MGQSIYPGPSAVRPITPVSAVLVVEDQPLLLMAAIELVTTEGFTAIEARNADEAVAILERRADIRVIFSDIDMPGSMDGMKLAACVRDRWPPVRIILTSGRAKPGVGELPSGSLFFAKPYTRIAVASAIRQMAA